MTDSTRLSGPGELSGSAPPETEAVKELPGEPLAELAASAGLRPSAERPSLGAYLKSIWGRRYFILTFATARNIAMYTESRLGQIWQVLTPLLNAGVYFLVFGLIFGANRGISNYTAFLVTGVFIFSFTERSMLTGSKVIGSNLPLIRALRFPRACLPLGYVIVELEQLLLSMIVLVAIVLITGEPLTWYWLFVPVVLLMQTLFNLGAGLAMARMGGEVRDISQLLPFLLRTWRYFCGVMYSVSVIAHGMPHIVQKALAGNPAAVYISLMRWSLLATDRADEPGAQPYNAAKCAAFHTSKVKPPPLQAYCHPILSVPRLWVLAVAWAVVTLAVGFIYFWRAEARYGRG
jgi:teichoic acid transport system permease protein